jgi:hypothetical protein
MISLVILFSAWPTCKGPFAYGGPSCNVNVSGAFPLLSGFVCELFCHKYSSSVHWRRYSALEAASGRAGKPDLGRRSVEDHDARRIRVGVSMVASWAGWKEVGIGRDIFRALRLSAMARRWRGDVVDWRHSYFGNYVYCQVVIFGCMFKET